MLEEVLAERHRLDRVDEAGAAVVVGAQQVGAALHQEDDDVQVRHEAGRAHLRCVAFDSFREGGRAIRKALGPKSICLAVYRRGSRVGHGVDVGAVGDEALDDGQAAGDGGTPQRRHVVHRPVVGHLVAAALLHLGVARAQQVLDDLDVALLACDEQRRACNKQKTHLRPLHNTSQSIFTSIVIFRCFLFTIKDFRKAHGDSCEKNRFTLLAYVLFQVLNGFSVLGLVAPHL